MDVSHIVHTDILNHGLMNESRGSGISEVLGSTREDSPLDRRQDELAWEITSLCVG